MGQSCMETHDWPILTMRLEWCQSNLSSVKVIWICYLRLIKNLFVSSKIRIFRYLFFVLGTCISYFNDRTRIFHSGWFHLLTVLQCSLLIHFGWFILSDYSERIVLEVDSIILMYLPIFIRSYVPTYYPHILYNYCCFTPYLRILITHFFTTHLRGIVKNKRSNNNKNFW